MNIFFFVRAQINQRKNVILNSIDKLKIIKRPPFCYMNRDLNIWSDNQ